MNRSRSLSRAISSGAIALVAIVAVAACSSAPAADPSIDPSTSPAPVSTPRPSPDPTPVPTVPSDPVPSAPASPEPEPTDGGTDAMPIHVDLANATGADVSVDIVDETGHIESAVSGQPGDGVSVEAYTLAVENVDDRTLRLTWIDYPVDNDLALYVMNHEGGLRLLLVQPEPTVETDAIAFDRELILAFDQPIVAADVETFLQEGLDTAG